MALAYDALTGAPFVSPADTLDIRGPRGALSGARAFIVSRMQPGSWTVTPSGGAGIPVLVGGDGVLSFVAAVGGGAFVDAVKT